MSCVHEGCISTRYPSTLVVLDSEGVKSEDMEGVMDGLEAEMVAGREGGLAEG